MVSLKKYNNKSLGIRLYLYGDLSILVHKFLLGKNCFIILNIKAINNKIYLPKKSLTYLLKGIYIHKNILYHDHNFELLRHINILNN